MKNISLKTSVKLLVGYGLIVIVFGFVNSVLYSFKIFNFASEQYSTDFSALVRSIPFGIIFFLLAYFLNRRMKWAYWGSLIFCLYFLTGTLLTLVLATESGVFVGFGVGLAVMLSTQVLFLLITLASLLFKKVRKDLFESM